MVSPVTTSTFFSHFFLTGTRTCGFDSTEREPVKDGRAYGEFESVDRFIELPGVGHCPMDEAPELINPLLMEFVEDYRGVTPGCA